MMGRKPRNISHWTWQTGRYGFGLRSNFFRRARKSHELQFMFRMIALFEMYRVGDSPLMGDLLYFFANRDPGLTRKGS